MAKKSTIQKLNDLNAQGNQEWRAGHRSEALAAFDHALALLQAPGHGLDPRQHEDWRARLQNNRGNVLRAMGRREEALEAYDEALGLHRQLAAGEPDAFTAAVAMTLNNRGTVLGDLGRREESLAAYDEALALYRDLAAREPDAFTPYVATTLNNRGNVLGVMGRREEALSAYDEALGLRRQLADRDPGAFTQYVAGTLNSRSLVLSALKKHEAALKAIEESLSLYRPLAEAEPTAFSGDLARALDSEGTVLSAAGRKDDALAAYEEAVSMFRNLAETEPRAFVPDLTTTLFNMVECLDENDARRAGYLAEVAEAAERTSDLIVRDEIKTRLSALRRNVSLEEIFERKQEWERSFRQFLGHKRAPMPAAGAPGVLQCLRKWASYTPIPLFREKTDDTDGGGFFLQWQGWGLCIDPGLGFGRVFRAPQAEWGPCNIDAILCTHHHIDHTGDMLPLLTCLFEMNEKDGTPHAMDFLLSGSAFAAHADLLAFLPGVRRILPLRPEEVVAVSDSVSVRPVRSDHKDLTGRRDGAVGFVLELRNTAKETCRLGFTGDTTAEAEVPSAMADTDLLVINVGSIYPKDVGKEEPERRNHLGINGVIEYLKRLKGSTGGTLKPLVLVSEWGEELGPFRRQLCEVIAERAGVPSERVWPAEKFAKMALWPDKVEPVCAVHETEVATTVVEANDEHGEPCLEYRCAKAAH